MKQAKLTLYSLLASLLVIFSTPANTLAIGGAYDPDFFSKNDIFFYNPDSSNSGCIPSGVFSGTISEEGKRRLDGAGVKDKIEKNKSAYIAGAQANDISWEFIAAIHYREAGLDPNRTIADGEPLGVGTSIDGQKVGGTLEEDAVIAGKKMADYSKQMDADITASSSPTVEDYGLTALAYNRGVGGAKRFADNGESYRDSPYVMNYIDDDHAGMPWSETDKEINREANGGWLGLGAKDANVGVLTVMAYIGAEMASGSEACSNASGDIISTAKNQAWENQDNYTTIKPTYLESLKNNGWSTSLSYAQDCGHFIASILHTSGFDTSFPAGGTSNMEPYLKKTTSKYQEIANTGDANDLQPGDIFVVNLGGGAGASGHIMMYIGDTKGDDGKTYNAVSASYLERTGNLDNIFFGDHRGSYSIFRPIGEN